MFFHAKIYLKYALFLSELRKNRFSIDSDEANVIEPLLRINFIH